MEKFRIISLAVMICLLITTASPVNAYDNNADSSSPTQKYYLPSVDLVKPFEQFTPNDGAFGIENGDDVIYTTTNGNPAVFCAYNLDKREVLFTSPLAGTKAAWTHAVAKDGSVYIAADGLMFRYIPAEKRIESLGRMLNEKACYNICFDEEGNVYLGTYPGGKIVRYNIITKSFEDLGQVETGHQYVRSLAYKDGYLYAGTFGANPKFVKVNAKNPSDKTIIQLPPDDGWFKPAEIQWFYNMNVVGDYIVMNVKQKTTAPLVIYDTKNQKFVEHSFKANYRGIHVSPERNGKFYFPSGSNLWEFDMASSQVTDTGMQIGTIGFYGAGWVTLENDPDFPGESLVTLSNTTGSPIVMNLQTKKFKTLTSVQMEGGAGHIHSIETGDNMNLYIGCYMGTKAAIYNTITGNVTRFDSHQPESILYYDGKGYFGTYTHAQIQEYDPSLPINTSNPKWLGSIGESQDRPFRMVGADNKIFMGSFPVYGQLGGALTVYDTITGKFDVYRNVVENQSVMSLTYKDGIIYGSTSIWGGLGITPTEDNAKIFLWDVATRTKIREFVPEIPGITADIYALGDISFGPDGLLWVAARNLIFAMDPNTFEVVKHIEYFDTALAYNKANALYRPYYIRWGDDGLLYTNAGANGIEVIDPNTMKSMNLDEQTGGTVACTLLTIGPDGNLYYNNHMDGSVLKMIPVSDVDFKTSDFNMVLSKLNDSIGIYMNKNSAIVNGKVTTIDMDNNNIKPFIENGKTFIPVQFAAKASGYEVNWNEAAQELLINGKKTASIKPGEATMTVDNKIMNLDVPAKLVNGKVFMSSDSLAIALEKVITIDERGLIIISDHKWKEDEITSKKVGLAIKYYTPQIKKYLDMKEEALQKYQSQIASLGTQVKVKNNSFEIPVESLIVPHWNKTTDTTENNYLDISNNFSFDGQYSINIVDKVTNAGTSLESDLIEIDPMKKYTLSTMLYIDSGRTSVGLYYYDANMNLVKKHDEHIQTGQKTWQNVIISPDIPATAKYAKVILYTSPYFMSNSYYDNVALFEQ